MAEEVERSASLFLDLYEMVSRIYDNGDIFGFVSQSNLRTRKIGSSGSGIVQYGFFSVLELHDERFSCGKWKSRISIPDG